MELRKVSVIMATYNEPANYIRESINSILNQTYVNLELIIVDDSTNCETRFVIDYFAAGDVRVKVIRTKERLGFVEALNVAIAASSGNYIARMDGDDVSVLDRIERQVLYLNDNPGIDICGGDLWIIDENGVIRSERRYPVTQSSIMRYFMLRSPLAHPTVMFRRKIFDDGFRYNPSYKKAEDICLWLSLRNAGYSFGNLGVQLLLYRVVGDLGKKRTRLHYKYLFKARFENFSFRYFYYDVFSLLVSSAYYIAPMKVISWFYNKELQVSQAEGVAKRSRKIF